MIKPTLPAFPKTLSLHFHKHRVQLAPSPWYLCACGDANCVFSTPPISCLIARLRYRHILCSYFQRALSVLRKSPTRLLKGPIKANWLEPASESNDRFDIMSLRLLYARLLYQFMLCACFHIQQHPHYDRNPTSRLFDDAGAGAAPSQHDPSWSFPLQISLVQLSRSVYVAVLSNAAVWHKGVVVPAPPLTLSQVPCSISRPWVYQDPVVGSSTISRPQI